MIPAYLYIENFLCHEASELNLSTFRAALVVGKVDGNELYSNGVGKSTIFKAIEFCIFNECSKGVKLDRLVRDDSSKCRVVFDFISNDKTYRISRSRTKKGVSDLSLYERTSYTDGSTNPHSIDLKEDIFKLFWTDISGRRVPDTEETLQKIHKMNYESFCSGYYFDQETFKSSGLATATKSERKKILKASLGLTVYTQLSKLASMRAATISKDIERDQAVLGSIGDPEASIIISKNKIKELDLLIVSQAELLKQHEAKVSEQTNILSELNSKFKLLSDQVGSVLKKQKDINTKYLNAESSVDDLSNKRKRVVTAARLLGEEIEKLKTNQKDLLEIDFSTLENKKEEFEKLKELVSQNSALIKSLQESLVELKIPLPDEGICKHCRQVLTDAHRRECEKSTNEEIIKKENKILELKESSSKATAIAKELQQNIIKLESSKKELESLSSLIVSKEKEMSDKKTLFTDYDSMLKKNKENLAEILKEKELVLKEVEASSNKELEELQKTISLDSSKLSSLKSIYDQQNKTNSLTSNEKAILEHSILEKSKDIDKKSLLNKNIVKLEEDRSILSDLLEAFGPTGIPNLITQNVLDDFQIEANNILDQIRPGLQLEFVVEKTKGDGQIDDDLDINYFLNGKPREYGLLSGAQKVDVMFSLKLGLAYLHKKILGASMQMLLLDEVDPALDKAGVDAFADVIKFFSKDFTILVITHNDRLKDKFSHAILVNQDQNMVSKAQVVTDW